MFFVPNLKMFEAKTYNFPQNENVGKFIQDILENEENNLNGIAKVKINRNIYRKE